jgi:hypothetical protein
MSFRRLVPAVVLLAVFAMAVRVSTDSDTWWHLRAGAWMVEQRQLLTSDPFSLTRMGEPWIYPGWLAQLGLYGAYAAAGHMGLGLLTAAAVLAAFAFQWRTLDVPPLFRAFVVILAAMTSAVYWSARPQIFSFALAGAFVWALERERAGAPRRVWILPPLMALWANLHGGFAIGLMLIGAYLSAAVLEAGLPPLLGRMAWGASWEAHRPRLARLTGALVLSAAAVCVNPHGPALLAYPFKTVSIGVLQDYIQEWQSPNFHRAEVQPFLWMLLLTLAAFGLSGRRARADELVTVGAFAALALLAGRNIALFALAAAPALARHGYAVLQPFFEHAARAPQVPERRARWVNLMLLALAALAAGLKIALPFRAETLDRALRAGAPIEAVGWIESHRPTGALFNSYNWGGYVVWALHPDYPSFVDGRTDLFDDALLRDYLAAWRAEPGWEAILRRWDVRLALLEPGAPLTLALEHAGWARGYADNQAAVLTAPEGW